jgi:pyroglutamyl-peptidase
MTLTATSPLRLSLCWAALVAGSAFAEDQTAARVDRYVLFGFGPFAGRNENGSWQSAKQFAEGTQVRSLEVPVVWGAPRNKLVEVTKASGKVVLVGLGEGGGSYEVETVGFNERGNIHDEAGAPPAEQKIARDGEARLELNGPAQQLAEKLSAAGFPARTSKDAGRFLCNEMLYELLRMQRENPNVAAVYFIHVPVLGNQISRDGGKVPVNHAYCADFGRALVAALRELHPLVESATASAQ